MKSDISRNTFDPAKHFSRVIMQQGRVQLDADWNEQADILLHSIRDTGSRSDRSAWWPWRWVQDY